MKSSVYNSVKRGNFKIISIIFLLLVVAAVSFLLGQNYQNQKNNLDLSRKLGPECYKKLINQ
ncbi:hypothetical protein A2382_01595 [Candidatus Woesebacteria bacterium RIFOXYB1_FULL_38_16]|uniref:Uncharacterized protein n=1 Tax=Candidatus Woesebacteria bacterium RIFOXYB1_FULL_38_16 TaxID=1802538 RepID=A0A1F8CWL8_9BACT|nr:MAG: hypothetical protein A2191_03180 [Candidatus Woesebacteria bacterium RIFOXYA1_FULL_38_9]OGM80118.1 MAG: hypothetical protein A2382_01595 [Candidatus Woesebacteria bacterium RIFOXYB1_FULL_38_16]